MIHTHPIASLHGVRSNAVRVVNGPRVRQFLLLFVAGPRQLLTHEISAKCASLMIAMCAPSLLLCSLLTLPALLFHAPQHNPYFHFARVLDSDPLRWLVFVMAAVCALLSLVIPATMPPRRDPLDI